MERALIVSDGSLITAGQLGITPRREVRSDEAGAPPAPALPVTSLAEAERQMVADALQKARGNKSRAAKLLGLTRSQLYTRLKRFGLETEPL